MRNRIEIEELENGFEVSVWKEDKESDDMYPDAKKFVAKDKEEVMEIFEKHFKKMDEKEKQ